jgi:hypothetical protein
MSALVASLITAVVAAVLAAVGTYVTTALLRWVIHARAGDLRRDRF